MSTFRWSAVSPQDAFSILAWAGSAKERLAATTTAPNSFMIPRALFFCRRLAADPDAEQGSAGYPDWAVDLNIHAQKGRRSWHLSKDGLWLAPGTARGSGPPPGSAPGPSPSP